MKSARPLALLLALILLSGCSGRQNVITVMDALPTEAPALVNAMPTPSLNAPAPLDSSAYIAPAPADVGAAPAAGVGVQAENSDADAELVVGAVADLGAAVHPLKCKYTDLNNINGLVFEGLVTLNDAYQPTPLLADRWTVANDVWTFTLRSGIKFHNGRLLSAADVVASYEEIMKNPGTLWYAMCQNIEGMVADDDLTLRVKSKGMGYMLLYAMTFPIVQRDTMADDAPMGTGPYWYIYNLPGERLRIESNPLWWRRSSDEVHTIICKCYSTSKKALTALATGEIDTLATRSANASIHRNLSDRMSLDYSTNTYECIVPRLDDAIVGSAKVRQAIMYAIDRTTLANTAYVGMVQDSEVPVIPGSWLYDAQATKFHYSPERALQLLYEDGWSDVNGDGILEKEMGGVLADLELTLLTYNEPKSPTRTEAATALVEQLRKVGIAITVQTDARETVAQAMQDGNFQLVLGAFNLSTIPHLAFLFASSGSYNYSGYKSETMDDLLKEAYGAVTAAELQSAMSKIEIQIGDDLPLLGLFFRTGVLVSTTSIGGLSAIREGDALRGVELSTFSQ